LKTREEKVFQAVGAIFMIILAAVALIPIILLVIASFTSNNAIVQNGYSFIPKEWSFEAYEYMFLSSNKIIKAYGVSFFITAVGTVCSLVITTMLAYGLSKRDLPGRGFITFYIVFTMLFNGGLVPTYLMYTGIFNIKNTIWALLIPNLLMNAYNIMLAKSYFVTSVPNEILEAAKIDGAGEFRIFVRIAVPIAKPIIATIGMFVGIAYWNDWNNGFIYLTTNTDLYSIQNLLNRMIQNIQFLTQNSAGISQAQQGLAQIPASSVRMAMAVMGILPIVLIYPFIQNNFVKGITLGGVKG